MDDNQWDAVAEALGAAGYPANRQDLINHARHHQADERILEQLRGLPVGIYRNLVDVRNRLETSRPSNQGRV
jgi:hypothetical protein